VLFTPDAHEPLTEEEWDADKARAAIVAIAANTEAAFDDGWPLHPLDFLEGEDESRRLRGIYDGGAGVVAALDRLARRGYVALQHDYVPYLQRSAEAPPDYPEWPRDGSWAGQLGIRFVLQRLAPSEENLARMSDLIAAHERDERRELLFGSAGSILIGRELGLDVTASVEWLRGERDEDGLWTQQMFGRRDRYIGPAHGFAGCVLALGDPDDVSETLRRFAVHEDGLVNWPPTGDMTLQGNRDGQIRMQWCHGAPGIVATLAPWLDDDLALGGGELTWLAGPLRKGANLCHGTAGNGYAFLSLFEQTGDEEWLARARAFAMHAAGQVEESRSAYGRGRYSLWTGDPGTALFLADCVEGGGGLPLP